jgi:pimeloyl-ACP methyl ester carboxylesterase
VAHEAGTDAAHEAGTDAPDWFRRALDQAPEEGEVRVDGAKVHWLAWGERTRPTLALQHGGAANAWWWSFIGPLLADEYRVVAPELTGHGDSDWRESYRNEQWAEEVFAVVDAAAGHVDRPYLAGHSLGSQVAAVAAARHGERLAGAVLVDFGIRTRGEQSQSAQRADRTYRDQPSREAALARFRIIPWQPCANDFIVRHIAERSVVARGEGRWGWKFDPNLFTRTTDRFMGDYLADVRIPLALMPGQDSRLVPPEITSRALTELARPTPVVVIPAAHHHVMLDQPLAFVAALRGLLAAWRAEAAPRAASSRD